MAEPPPDSESGRSGGPPSDSKWLFVNPLGSEPVTNDMRLQFDRVRAAFENPARACDSMRFGRGLLPPHLEVTPLSGWPKVPPLQCAGGAIFLRNLPLDALFFLFYYREGTHASIQAAKALKAKNWRFNKVLNVWMQRLREPSLQTTVYERGHFKYWDVESWSEKHKLDYTLHYASLENCDLNRWSDIPGQWNATA